MSNFRKLLPTPWLKDRGRRQISWCHWAEARTDTGPFSRSWSRRGDVAVAENNKREAGGEEYLGLSLFPTGFHYWPNPAGSQRTVCRGPTVRQS